MKDFPLLKIPQKILEECLSEIQSAGGEKREGFALLLGNLKVRPWVITEVYIPEYVSGPQFYKITELGDLRLADYLISKKLMVVAQLHSHPNKAFHSDADDRMATVGHIDGFSFVLPDFGMDTTIENFYKKVKSYQLKKGGDWVEAGECSWAVA